MKGANMLNKLKGQPTVNWGDLIEIQIPGGVELISRARVLEVLLDATLGPMPEATMDGEVRKSALPPFASMDAKAPTEELTDAEHAWLEIAWNAAGLPWPEHPTVTDWATFYLPAFRDAEGRPSWTPVSNWGQNRKIAERNRELCRRKYEAEVFADMPTFGATGLPATPDFGYYWSVDDVRARTAAMAALRPVVGAEAPLPASALAERGVEKRLEAPGSIAERAGLQRSMQLAILTAIRALGADPQAMPKNAPGMSGMKAAVRDHLNIQPHQASPFLHAWDALLQQTREIKYAD